MARGYMNLFNERCCVGRCTETEIAACFHLSACVRPVNPTIVSSLRRAGSIARRTLARDREEYITWSSEAQNLSLEHPFVTIIVAYCSKGGGVGRNRNGRQDAAAFIVRLPPGSRRHVLLGTIAKNTSTLRFEALGAYGPLASL
jgi:hypothetical protein